MGFCFMLYRNGNISAILKYEFSCSMFRMSFFFHQIWQAAASQVFFSLGVSFGSLIAYAAANTFNNNFYK